MIRSKTTIAVPPGATIKEMLVDREMTQKEFAARMEMSEKHISKLINGEVHLTPDVAMRLEMVLGMPAHFWSNLESIYQEDLLMIQIEKAMEADREIVKKIPYNEMAKLGWVPDTCKGNERIMYLRKYFEVVRLGLIQNPAVLGIACRKLREGEKSDFALLAWAQKAKLEARSIQTAALNLAKLQKSLPEIRKMTQNNPNDFCPSLCTLLADCGIALVFLPHIGGSFLHGATFTDGPKTVIGLTVRGKDADKFWFSLFHEIGHVVLGHIGPTGGTTDEEERAADAFARNCLIPSKAYDAFVKAGSFEKADILRFAAHIEIDPGIVVGRLQKESIIPYTRCNELKTKYEMPEDKT